MKSNPKGLDGARCWPVHQQQNQVPIDWKCDGAELTTMWVLAPCVDSVFRITEEKSVDDMTRKYEDG